MTAAIYALSAVLVAMLATRAWLLDRDDPARRAFMAFGWALGAGYLCFALAMLPGVDALRLGYLAAMPVAAAAAYRTVDTLFDRGTGPDLVHQLAVPASYVLAPALAVLQALSLPASPRTTALELGAGVFCYGLAALLVRRVHHARETAELVVERTRLGWLQVSAALVPLATAVEWALRTSSPVADPASLAFLDRGLVLQGALPPVSSLMAAGSAYVLYHAMLAKRLVALQEVLTRVAVVSLSALALVVVYVATQAFVALTRFPLHSGFLLFLLTALFLSAYRAAHDALTRTIGRVLNPAGQALSSALDDVVADLPRHVTTSAVAAALADPLYASGRFQAVTVYLFDRGVDAYRRLAARGAAASGALEAVAALPFTAGFRGGADAYLRAPLARAGADEIVQLLDAQHADAAVPLRADGDGTRTIYGWVALRDEVWSDGLSPDERARLARAADAAARALRNIENFRQLEEDQRLAALGAMSAGLAHEIRNPLAGVKGAAQVLATSHAMDADNAEMLDVIITEADRLDRVVRQFLDYARPFQLRVQAEDAERLARHAVAVVSRGSLPEGVTLAVEAEPDLPAVAADADRLTQVLLNLLHNAVDAAAGQEAGRREVRVALLRASLSGGRPAVEIAVRDDGPGLDPETAAQIFTPFFTTKQSGTGLGLPITRRLVEAHGGALDVRSREGAGATFAVRLPVAR